MRVLLTGWPSFLNGEATAGDVLSMDRVRRALVRSGVPCEVARSQVFRPGSLGLEDADPKRYTHLVFFCGPVHGEQCDGCTTASARAAGSQSASPCAIRPILRSPVSTWCSHQANVNTASDAGTTKCTNGSRRGCWNKTVPGAGGHAPRPAAMAQPSTPGQLDSVLCRLDSVLTTRLHGLVLALRQGVPVLAVDPVDGGGKVGAQAAAWGWPALVTVSEVLQDVDCLRPWWNWCLSAEGGCSQPSAQQPPSMTVSN